MGMEEIKSNKGNEVMYDREKKIVHYRMYGTINFESAKEAMEAVRVFTKTNKVLGTVADMSESKGTFTKLNKYIEAEYMPDMIKQGMKCSAMVVPNDVFLQFSADKLISRMGSFTMQVFPNLEEANAWVEEVVAE